ncbi:MAG: hypothetical protein J6K05_10770 [Bacteroidaceae bacterium]|nr:hypothetical protein [Bacteroidaceae bacterium]
MMKNSSIIKWGLLFISFAVSACEKTEKEIVSHVAKEFTEAYYNLEIRKAKEYCSQELHTIMDFRHNNLTERDLAYKKTLGKAEVKILKCEISTGNDIAYLDVEISNFMRINYMNDSLFGVPCDTIELTLVKEHDNNWRVKNPL